MNSNPRGASVVGEQDLASRISMVGRLHVRGLISSLGRLTQSVFSSAMSVTVIAIALALPLFLYVLVDNVQTVSEQFIVTNQIALYIDTDISDDESLRMAEKIRENPDVESVTVISRQAGFREFRKYSGFAGALDILDYNPLPVVIQVHPREAIQDPAVFRRLISDLEKLQGVDFARFDMQWVRRLKSMTEIVERGVLVLAILLSVGVVFVVSNTIRLELRGREDEIIVMKLLGATDGFIRRPFLYGGFWYGFLGGVLACLIVLIALLVFEGPVNSLSTLYESEFELIYLGLVRTLYLLAFSSLLGIAGAWLVLANQLSRMNPR